MRINRYFRYQYLRILRLKDAPDKIARGVALGVALDFLPLPFISLFVAWIVAKLARWNTLAAVITAAALKPAVFTIFFPLNILVGSLFVEGRTVHPQQVQVPVAEPGMDPHSLANFFSLATLKSLGWPFLVGSFINAGVSFLLVYLLVNRTLIYRMEKRLARLKTGVSGENNNSENQQED